LITGIPPDPGTKKKAAALYALRLKGLSRVETTDNNKEWSLFKVSIAEPLHVVKENNRHPVMPILEWSSL
jgi:hypothetical protein